MTKPRVIHIFFILIFILNAGIVKAQDSISVKPHATIHFVRSSRGLVMGSFCESKIVLANQKKIKINIKSVIDYTIFTTGKVRIKLETLCVPDAYLGATPSVKECILNIETGKEYYVLYDVDVFQEVKKEEVEKQLKQAENYTYPYSEDPNYLINDKPRNNNEKILGQGSGFLLNKEGYIITNYHVVDDIRSVHVKGINGDINSSFEAKVISIDRQNDLALLKVDSVDFDDPPYKVIDSKDVKQGQSIFILGYPVEEYLGSEIKVTDGIVNSKSGFKGSISEFQISAGVQPGNSGGPLFDKNGDVIGVVSAKIVSQSVESVGYAVKSSYLMLFLEQIDDIDYKGIETRMNSKDLPDQVELASKFVYIIETK